MNISYESDRDASRQYKALVNFTANRRRRTLRARGMQAGARWPRLRAEVECIASAYGSGAASGICAEPLQSTANHSPSLSAVSAAAATAAPPLSPAHAAPCAYPCTGGAGLSVSPQPAFAVQGRHAVPFAAGLESPAAAVAAPAPAHDGWPQPSCAYSCAGR